MQKKYFKQRLVSLLLSFSLHARFSFPFLFFLLFFPPLFSLYFSSSLPSLLVVEILLLGPEDSASF